MVLRSILNFTAHKRVPLIKFRVGGNYNQSGATSQGAASQSGAIEDWELPKRFKRKPIASDEMAYINNGGPL